MQSKPLTRPFSATNLESSLLNIVHPPSAVFGDGGRAARVEAKGKLVYTRRVAAQQHGLGLARVVAIVGSNGIQPHVRRKPADAKVAATGKRRLCERNTFSIGKSHDYMYTHKPWRNGGKMLLVVARVKPLGKFAFRVQDLCKTQHLKKKGRKNTRLCTCRHQPLRLVCRSTPQCSGIGP